MPERGSGWRSKVTSPGKSSGTEEWGVADAVPPTDRGRGQGAWLSVESASVGSGGGKGGDSDGWRGISPSGYGSGHNSHVSSQADNWTSDHEEGSSSQSTGESRGGGGGEGSRDYVAAPGVGLSSGSGPSSSDGFAANVTLVGAPSGWDVSPGETIGVDLDRELDSYTGESVDEDEPTEVKSKTAGVRARPVSLDQRWGKGGGSSDVDDLDADSLSSSDRDTAPHQTVPSLPAAQNEAPALLMRPSPPGAAVADGLLAMSVETEVSPLSLHQLDSARATGNGSQDLDAAKGQFLSLTRGESSSSFNSQESPLEFGPQVDPYDSVSPVEGRHPPQSLDVGSGGGGGGGGGWVNGRSSVSSTSSVNSGGSAWKGDTALTRGLQNRATSPRKNSRCGFCDNYELCYKCACTVCTSAEYICTHVLSIVGCFLRALGISSL